MAAKVWGKMDKSAKTEFMKIRPKPTLKKESNGELLSNHHNE